MKFSFDTALGKSIKVLFYVGLSAAVSGVLAYLTKNPDFFSPVVVVIINTALVAVKNVLDKNVKNF